MKSAINILKMSFDNLKSEFLRKQEESKELKETLNGVEDELKTLSVRMSDIELAIEKLNKKESNASSKNKKAE